MKLGVRYVAVCTHCRLVVLYYFGTHADKNSVTHKTGGATTFRNRDVIWLRFKGT